MFEHDTILPEQFSALQGRPLQREKRLLFAILEDAIHCFQTYFLATRDRERRLFQEAEEWLYSTDSEWLFSFENVCEMLDLQPAYLRGALSRWKGESLSRNAWRLQA